MPQSRPRHTPYGRPLPTLAPAPAPVPATDLVEASDPLELSEYIQAVLTRYGGELLQAGCFADVVIHLIVDNGHLQPDLDVSVTRHHRFIRTRG